MGNMKTRLAGATLASALAITGLGLVTSTASAVDAGRRVLGLLGAGRHPIEAPPASNISSTLAPWTDSAASPAGAADYMLATSGGTAVGTSRSISLTFNKGPKNGGPASERHGLLLLLGRRGEPTADLQAVHRAAPPA